MWEIVNEEESGKKSEYGLSCWLVFPAAKRERMCALSYWLACSAVSQCGSVKRKTRQVCPARKACVEEDEIMLPCLFIVAQRSDPGKMAWNILIGRKYKFETKTVKIFLRQTRIWNSFCYNCVIPRNLFSFGIAEGGVIFSITSILFLLGCIPLSDIMCPKYRRVFFPNSHYPGFNFIPDSSINFNVSSCL